MRLLTLPMWMVLLLILGGCFPIGEYEEGPYGYGYCPASAPMGPNWRIE